MIVYEVDRLDLFFSVFVFPPPSALGAAWAAGRDSLHSSGAPEALWFTHRATARYDACPLAGFGGLNNILYYQAFCQLTEQHQER